MGCGSSGSAVVRDEHANGNGTNGTKHDHYDDDLPTVILPEPIPQPKPPVAFEIPLEDLDSSHKGLNSPPPHLQRLLLTTEPEITLPSIEEKLAEAEQRRQMILQQRAASAQKRTHKMMRSMHEMGRMHSKESLENIPPEPGVVEDKNP